MSVIQAERSMQDKASARWPFVLSLCLHAAALLLLGLRLEMPAPEPHFSLRMVRLAGGGSGKPGWATEAPAPAPVSQQTPATKPLRDSRPQPEAPVAKPAAKPAPRQLPTSTASVEREAPVLRDETTSTTPIPAETVQREEREGTTAETVSHTNAPAIASTNTSSDDAGTGREHTLVTQAGPAGAGRGAVADEQGLPGLGAWLGRVESQIQQRFQYPARDTGARAVFHFYIERDGSVSDLTLTQSSELPGLDHAGRSAITRAVCPPLPASFRHSRLGVTFTFVDER